MGVKIEKSVFEQLIKKFVNEHNNSRTAHSTRIDQIAGPELPVLPNEHMPLQLSSEMPNVADDAYMPTTTSALSDAAATIAQEVPSSQVEFFYNQLHNLLKRVMDREEEARIPMMEALLFEAADDIMREIAETGQSDAELDAIEDAERTAFIDEPAAVDNEDFMTQDNTAEVTAEKVARAIIVNGHTSKDAIHDKKDNMNLNIGDVKDSSANFVSFGHKARKVTLPPELAYEVFTAAVKEDSEIKEMYKAYIKSNLDLSKADIDIKLQLSVINRLKNNVIDELRKKMTKTSVISVEDASEMHANTIYDKLKKSITEEDLEQTIEEVVDEVINNIKNGPKVLTLQLRGLAGSYDVPSDMFISHLEAAKKKNAPAAMSKEVADEEFGSEEEKDLEAAEALFDVDRAEKRLESNLEYQSSLYGLAGANGMRQWFQKHPEQKFMTIVKGGVGVSGEKMYDQTYSALEALIMSPGVEKWIKKIRKKTPVGLRPESVEKVIAGLESIIADVTTGDEEIDFDKLRKTPAGLILRGAFDNLLLGKTFTTFYNHREKFSEQLIAHLDLDKKLRLSIINMLAGISSAPSWDKSGKPLSRNAEKVIEAGITIEEFKRMSKEVSVEIEEYFDNHLTDIKKFYNKKLQSDNDIVTAFNKSVIDTRSYYEEIIATKNVKKTLDAEREEQQQ